MSTFIWGKIQYKSIPEKSENYQNGDILVYFGKPTETTLFKLGLNKNEVYFNIACGYENIIKRDKYCLNCDSGYFFINAPKHEKNLEPYFNELYNRIKKLQAVIAEIYERPEVEKITYFHTDTGNEISLDEYKVVDWKIEEFAKRFFDAIEECRGLTPTIQATFTKNK